MEPDLTNWPESAKLLSGVGIGLRSKHVQEIIRESPDIAWFEVLADNYLTPSESAQRDLERICQRYPIAMHSVGISLGSTDELDTKYLSKLKALADRFSPRLISDHLAWTSVHGHHFHDLLPLPYTEEVAIHVAERIKRVQDYLCQRILIENVSCYLNFAGAALSEWEFLNLVAELSDCNLLLDINNIYVNSRNHNFDPMEYLQGICTQRVRQFHLGGHEERNGLLFDAHGSPVAESVWRLYGLAVERFGFLPTLIEWDNELPELSKMIQEVAHATAVAKSRSARFASNAA